MHVLVTEIPTWMGEPQLVEFRGGDDVKDALGIDDPAYVLTLQLPAAMAKRQAVPPSEEIAFGLFGDFETSLDVGLQLIVYAQLLKDPQAVIEADDWHAEAKWLGRDLFQRVEGSLEDLLNADVEGFANGASLEFQTLQIDFHSENLADSLGFDSSFAFTLGADTGTWTIPIPGDTPVPPEGEDPQTGNPVQSTLLVQEIVSPGATAIEFDYNALSARSDLTVDQHVLEVYLVPLDSNPPLLLDSIALDELSYQVNDHPLGLATGWQQAPIPIPSDALQSGQNHFVQFQLSTDASGGEKVAVALDRLRFVGPESQVELLDPNGILSDQLVDFASETDSPITYSLPLANQGEAALVISQIQLQGNGFSIASGSEDFVVLPDSVVNLGVNFDTLAADSTAVLSFHTNDEDAETITLQMDGADLFKSWHNVLDPPDVNNNEQITPQDLAILVRDLRVNGSRILPPERPEPGATPPVGCPVFFAA